MKKLSALLFIAVAIVGCGEKSVPVQTVDWYKAHETERLSMIEKCKTNPGELAASPNCINAKTAANHIAVDKRGYQKLIPINPLKEGN